MKADPVSNPPHYTAGGIECIDYLRAKLHPAQYIGFLRGNAIKYLTRMEDKGDAIGDAAKAAWYTQRLADFVKGVG